VLEARERVGGRTLNHALRNGGWSEAGGQWIGPGQTAVADLARELEIETFESEYLGRSVYRAGGGRVAVRTDGEVEYAPALTAEIESLARALPAEQVWNADGAAALDRISVADWLATRSPSPLDRVSFQVA
jgi:monoamine oxidase